MIWKIKYKIKLASSKYNEELPQYEQYAQYLILWEFTSHNFKVTHLLHEAKFSI